MEIPFTQLSQAALRGVIEEFVSREGTDYGGVAVDLETKVEQVLLQLERGEARLTYDPDTETCSLERCEGSA